MNAHVKTLVNGISWLFGIAAIACPVVVFASALIR